MRFGLLGELRFDPLHSMENLFREFRMEPLMRDVETMPRIRVDISEDDQAYSVKPIYRV
jgi:HSP20 family protein